MENTVSDYEIRREAINLAVKVNIATSGLVLTTAEKYYRFLTGTQTPEVTPVVVS